MDKAETEGIAMRKQYEEQIAHIKLEDMTRTQQLDRDLREARSEILLLNERSQSAPRERHVAVEENHLPKPKLDKLNPLGNEVREVRKENPRIIRKSTNNPQALIATLPQPPSQPALFPTAVPAGDRCGWPDPQYTLPASTTYRPLSQMHEGGRYDRDDLVAVVRYACLPKKVHSKVRDRPEWMQCLGLVDPSLDVAAGGKFKLQLYSTQRNSLLPETAAAGDCLVVRNMRVRRYRGKSMGLGYADYLRFAYVSAASVDMAPSIATNPSTYVLEEADKPIVSHLRDWYGTVAAVIAILEEKFKKTGDTGESSVETVFGWCEDRGM